MSARRPLLTTAEAARRIGVKPETLYAYVSRGLLNSTRAPDGRSSLFDPADVDRLVARPRRGGPGRAGFVIHSQLGPAGSFRGIPAIEIAVQKPFEEVIHWLWTGSGESTGVHCPPRLSTVAHEISTLLPPPSTALDRIRAVVAGIAAIDPLRDDLRTPAVIATARALLAAISEGLRESGGGLGSYAERLWMALSPGPLNGARVLERTLSLLADDGVTAPALAARLAASARAHPYAVVSAGLAVLDSPRHRVASAPVHRLLVSAADEGPGAVVSRVLAEGRGLPGFRVSPDVHGDPRPQALLEWIAADPPDEQRWQSVTEFIASSARGSPLPPGLDLALGALTFTSGMAPDAGEAILAIARIAGWIAHAIEEYAEPPDRFLP
jgi:citrate synthase